MTRGPTVQPDLFGEFDTAEAQQAAWLARFGRRDFPAPYRTGSYSEGDTVHGWLCPACGDVEWGEYILMLNHGYDPTRPGAQPYGAEFGETCYRIELRASQAASAAARAAKGDRA